MFYLHLKVQSYELRDNGILIKSGIIAKKQALILYSEIQDVQEHQFITERIFGIQNLTILTLAKLRSGLLTCLKKEEAAEIKHFLLAKAKIGKKEEVRPKVSKVLSKQYRVHPVKKTLVVILLLFFFLIFGFIISFSLGISLNKLMIQLFFSFFVFSIFSLVNAFIETISFRLSFLEDVVSIGREFLSKNFVNLPYEKIQDVSVFRGPFDRILEFGGIVIETGEGLGYVGGRSKYPLNIISNLYYKDALEIREFVLEKSGIKNLKTESLRKEFPLEKRKILKKSVSSTFRLFVALAIATSIIYPLEQFWGSLLLRFLPIFLLVFFLTKLVYEIFYFKSYSYSDNEEILSLKKGVIKITEVTIPYEKVQNVFVHQDLFDRIFKLYDVHLSTIGTISQMKLHIDGVSRETAEKLKEWLLNRIRVKK
ncbi:MAG: PH domain-containing protein [Candidatus Aenigmatarchaeota archaeon]